MDNTETFLTIKQPSEGVLFKEKNSKFFGYCYPITTDDEIKPILELLRKQHQTAGHFCYAYQIGTTQIKHRTNDDGEPNNSAGMPIYGQILSHQLTNIFIIVVRYFGGTKLGVGGLISAYKNTAQLAIEASEVIEKKINTHFIIQFDYKNMNKVMRIIKEKNLTIVSQKMNENCEIIIATRKKNANIIFDIFNIIYEVEIKEISL